ncbi:lysine-specific demethylase 7A [Ambystoma mexicanum]|uniref:lysine-specific demethylase 7A n=1 Tax=Ambystoma mexicanum TaxID=8296 RepID=UPI0037E7E4FC
MAGVAVPVYCVCRQPYDVSRFMIECDICKDWFHGGCVGIEEHHAADIDLYHCPNCDVLHGSSLMKKRRNWHRHDYTEADDGTKPVQAGTRAFVEQLQARSFPSADDVVQKMQGGQLTQRHLEKHGFNSPIMVPRLDDLGLRLPPPTFSVLDVEHCVGGNKVIDVIDVARQADSKMKLRNFIEYFMNPERPKVLNVISLEFSDTKMSDLVKVPDIAKKLSWVENYWPDDSVFPKPFVQKYCLMGVQGSYTDFHIDFGGTSVWYHVLWGEKIFYLIKPTEENLSLYELWSSSVTQSEEFFGDKVDQCYKCVVKQGHTLFVPTGWIHAVLTSQDCMAFGGNFLHNLNIGMQLRCYEMEKRLKTPDLFKFPFFEAICWFVAKNLLETLKELREDGFHPPNFLVQGVKALVTALKSWMKKESVSEHAFEIPDCIRPGHLVKELWKVIRCVEEDTSKPVKSQGTLGPCHISSSRHERRSFRDSRRRARKLRDHSSKTPSNLDILELHTRKVLKRLEMSPWEEDSVSLRLAGKCNKPLLPSTVPELRSQDNDLRLLLSNGKIIRDERNPFRDRSLFSADSEDEDNRARSKTPDLKVEEPRSLSDTDIKDEIQKPLNIFFDSVNSDLRNGSLKYSDISDSDISDASCTTQKDSSDESDSSGDEAKEECLVKRHPSDSSTLQSRNESSSTRYCPTSTSNEEEAIQGMLSMAGLHYTTCLPSSCIEKRGPPLGSGNVSPLRREERPSFHCIKAEEHEVHVKEERLPEMTSVWVRQMEAAARLMPQDASNDQQSTVSGDHTERRRRHRQSGSDEEDERWHGCSPQISECTQDSMESTDDCRLSDGVQNSECTQDSIESIGGDRLSEGSLSPDRPYSETSLTVPLHPTKRPASNPPPISNQATKGKRPKKGMATAKQRLGKILKLNRHGQSRFFV